MLGPLEQQHRRQAEHRHQGQQSKVIHVRQERRLLHQALCLDPQCRRLRAYISQRSAQRVGNLPKLLGIDWITCQSRLPHASARLPPRIYPLSAGRCSLFGIIVRLMSPAPSVPRQSKLPRIPKSVQHLSPFSPAVAELSGFWCSPRGHRWFLPTSYTCLRDCPFGIVRDIAAIAYLRGVTLPICPLPGAIFQYRFLENYWPYTSENVIDRCFFMGIALTLLQSPLQSADLPTEESL